MFMVSAVLKQLYPRIVPEMMLEVRDQIRPDASNLGLAIVDVRISQHRFDCRGFRPNLCKYECGTFGRS